MTQDMQTSSHSVIQTGSQEGLITGKDGIKPSDREFHEQAMLTDPSAEQQDLAAIEAIEADLAERQVIKIARAIPAKAKACFLGLIRRYPNHPKRKDWETRTAD